MARKQQESNDQPHNVLQSITEQQQQFIEHLLMGKSITDSALSCGVSRRAAVYWMHSMDHPVRHEYDLQRVNMRQKFHSRIASLHEKALTALEASLSEDAPAYIRFAAAKFLYEAHMQEYSNVRWPTGPDQLVTREVEDAFYISPHAQNGVSLYDDRGRERLPDDE